MSKLLAFWLLPAPDFSREFDKIIAALAQRFDAPGFTPHLTIHGSKMDAVPPLDLAAATRAISPITLKITGIGFSEKFTKTLFVEFDDSPELTALSRQLVALLPVPGDYQLKPHLSLVYAQLAESQKRALAEEIRLPFSEVSFDGVCVISGSAKTETRKDLETWRVVAETRLQKR